jgi:hypothetical protein
MPHIALPDTMHPLSPVFRDFLVLLFLLALVAGVTNAYRRKRLSLSMESALIGTFVGLLIAGAAAWRMSAIFPPVETAALRDSVRTTKPTTPPSPTPLIDVQVSGFPSEESLDYNHLVEKVLLDRLGDGGSGCPGCLLVVSGYYTGGETPEGLYGASVMDMQWLLYAAVENQRGVLYRSHDSLNPDVHRTAADPVSARHSAVYVAAAQLADNIARNFPR